MKNILIFNDISGIGNCSTVANLPILTHLGHYCMPVITGMFSCHTGFEKFTFQRNQNLSQSVADISRYRKADAIYVGFCVDKDILKQIAQVVEKAPDAYVFVDPILGDNGSLYSIFDGDYVSTMKRLVPYARCISPNLTEACLLADVNYEQLVSHSNDSNFFEICQKTFENFLQKTGAKSAVITGVESGDVIGNVVLSSDGSTKIVTNKRVNINFSGTGDAFSSALLGELLCGRDLVKAVEISANFVGTSAAKTQCTDRRFGVEFFRALDLL